MQFYSHETFTDEVCFHWGRCKRPIDQDFKTRTLDITDQILGRLAPSPPPSYSYILRHPHD